MIKVWIGTGIFIVVSVSIMAYLIIASNWDDTPTVQEVSKDVTISNLERGTKQENARDEEPKDVSYYNGSTLLKDQETFIEQFNQTSDTFKIDKVVESNKKNNLLFKLTSSNSEASPLYYLTAINNPEKDQLVQVSLSMTGVNGLSDTFKEEEWLELAYATYYGLGSTEEGMLEFEKRMSFEDEEVEIDLAADVEIKSDSNTAKIKQQNWRNKQHDIYTDRTEEGAVLGIYPTNTFSHYVLEDEKSPEIEE